MADDDWIMHRRVVYHFPWLRLLQIHLTPLEDIRTAILPMALNGSEAIAAMGNDTPLAVLSNRHQPLFNYFKQLFAQVTNPPIDAIRENFLTSTTVYVGRR